MHTGNVDFLVVIVYAHVKNVFFKYFSFIRQLATKNMAIGN